MNSRALSAMLLLGVLSASVPAIGQTANRVQTFQARLSTVPIDLAMAKTIAGRGGVTATLKGRTVAIAGKFSGLRSAATAVRLHRSSNRGMRGPAIGDLVATAATAGEITGSVELTATQVEDLEKGRLYVQLHSEQAPDGNLWGWLTAK